MLNIISHAAQCSQWSSTDSLLLLMFVILRQNQTWQYRSFTAIKWSEWQVQKETAIYLPMTELFYKKKKKNCSTGYDKCAMTNISSSSTYFPFQLYLECIFQNTFGINSVKSETNATQITLKPKTTWGQIRDAMMHYHLLHKFTVIALQNLSSLRQTLHCNWLVIWISLMCITDQSADLTGVPTIYCHIS